VSRTAAAAFCSELRRLYDRHMTIEGDQPRQSEQADDEERYAYVGSAVAVRNAWDWMQIIGLGCLAAGVAVLVVFALTLGGR
jgi:hypothetical protein